MSGLAAILAGHTPPGTYRWHGAFEAVDVRRTVELAGWAFGHVDGWVAGATKAEFLATVGQELDFPDYYGQNFDALADCLHDVGGRDGVLLLWDGWSTLAHADERAFDIALSVLAGRAHADRGVPFAVLLRGDGPALPDVPDLD